MYVEIRKNAELFLRAYEDAWVAEQILFGLYTGCRENHERFFAVS